MKCFICGAETIEKNNQFTCISCKRIWKDAGDGDWETIPQSVTITKPLKEGDTYSDTVKVD